MLQRFPDFDFPMACGDCELINMHLVDWCQLIMLVRGSMKKLKAKIARSYIK